MAKVLSVHKKAVNNDYRPASLLLICSKIFENLQFDSIYGFLDANCVLNSNQSGFWPNDSSSSLAITHDILTAFYVNPSFLVHVAVLDLPKAFDRVWHKGLLYKRDAVG